MRQLGDTPFPPLPERFRPRALAYQTIEEAFPHFVQLDEAAGWLHGPLRAAFLCGVTATVSLIEAGVSPQALRDELQRPAKP